MTFTYASMPILFVNFSDRDKIIFFVISSLLALMEIILLGVIHV